MRLPEFESIPVLLSGLFCNHAILYVSLKIDWYRSDVFNKLHFAFVGQSKKHGPEQVLNTSRTVTTNGT